MKSINEIKSAQQEIILASIDTARQSRSQAEKLSTKIEALDAKIKKLGDERWALYEEREVLCKQAESCEEIIKNA